MSRLKRCQKGIDSVPRYRPQAFSMTTKRVGLSWLSSLAGVGAVILPKGLCPICVAAWGGMLGSLGIVLVEENVRWILGLTLSVGLAGFALSVRRHRRWWTAALAVVAAVTTFVGRSLFHEPTLYGGIVLLVAATAADSWARKHPWAPLVQIRKKRGV